MVESTEDPSLNGDFVEWLRSLREYVVFQANCGTTSLPRDPTALTSIAAPKPVLTEPPASFKLPPPFLHSASETQLPKVPLDPSANQPTGLSAAATQGERLEKLVMLQQRVAGCTLCSLHEQRTQTVFARGTAKSGVCFVGEGPGADEDAQGLPFVGKAGQLLDRMIAAMGLDRNDVYVCNIVKCRPPNNRKPQPDETEACRPYLVEQLDLLGPDVIVALGATAVEGLLGISEGITRLRGKWKLYRGQTPVMPTFHPAYLLRNPSAKHAVWDDMCEVLRHLGRPLPAKTKS